MDTCSVALVANLAGLLGPQTKRETESASVQHHAECMNQRTANTVNKIEIMIKPQMSSGHQQQHMQRLLCAVVLAREE